MARSLKEWVADLIARRVSTALSGVSRLAEHISVLSLDAVDCPIITVVGTNGKGSMISGLCSVYSAQGYRVGAYISPHLHRWNERISINAQPVSDTLIVAAFEKIASVPAHVGLSLFDFFTLAALLIFKQHDVDLILLEAGIGGRCDAVNAVTAAGVILTSIGSDHAEILGHTREAIAGEKIGVFRLHQWAVSLVTDPPSLIAQRASELSMSLTQWGDGLSTETVADEPGTHRVLLASGDQVQIRLPAQYRVDHASAVCQTVENLKRVLPVDADIVCSVLENITVPGRYEYWADHGCVFDVAHNVQAVEHLACRLQRCFSDKTLIAVVALRQSKLNERLFMPLLPVINQWNVATLSSMAPAIMASTGELKLTLTTIGAGCVKEYNSVELALVDAVSARRKDQNVCVVVFGSFSAVALAQQYYTKS